ncbi:MAG: DUF4320 family protein [Firmicutes bacterium]|nr:DUF4320 family protein [[Eubacterium] siraeum]MCM1488175.1 DUF4320 family protein [Bacillota bacterium]
MFRKLLKSKRGEGYFDIVIVVLVVVMVIALIMAVAPVVSAKIQLDNYADELVREAEIAGRVGSETTARAQVLSERTGIIPTIVWSRVGKIQLNHEFTVTLTYKMNIGFGEFGSFPITLTTKASGRSECYWK